MKKVLIVTYYFPPAGGAGVQRTLKFVKYLRDFGWEPIVLTAKNADYPAYDVSLEAEIPKGIHVYRAPIFEPYRLYRRFTRRTANEATDIATLTLDEARKRQFSEKVSEWIRAAFFIPDARIAWLYPAVGVGKKIIESENIDLIYSSAPPYTTHLIGRRLKKIGKLPWVADFRDSWIGWLSAPQWRPGLSRFLEYRMEERVLAEADCILTVSNGVREDLLSRHNRLRDDRWAILPNGYDAEDFKDVIPAKRENRFIITYTGSLYGNRNPVFLLQALEYMIMEDKNLIKKLKIRLVGRVGQTIINAIQASIAGQLFEYIPYVTHHQSLAYLLASDASLLIIDDAPVNRGIITGKIFEYIGAKVPILILAPEGEATTLVRTNQLGWIVPPKDIPAIIATLKKMLKEKSRGMFVNNIVNYQQFERKEQTKKLASIFDEIIKED